MTLFAVLLSVAAAEVLTASLVGLGYTVAAATSCKGTFFSGHVSTTLILSIKKENSAPKETLEEICTFLTKRSIHWYHVMVMNDETWSVRHANIPEQPPAAPSPKTALERAASDEEPIG